MFFAKFFIKKFFASYIFFLETTIGLSAILYMIGLMSASFRAV